MMLQGEAALSVTAANELAGATAESVGAVVDALDEATAASSNASEKLREASGFAQTRTSTLGEFEIVLSGVANALNQANGLNMQQGPKTLEAASAATSLEIDAEISKNHLDNARDRATEAANQYRATVGDSREPTSSAARCVNRAGNAAEAASINVQVAQTIARAIPYATDRVNELEQLYATYVAEAEELCLQPPDLERRFQNLVLAIGVLIDTQQRQTTSLSDLGGRLRSYRQFFALFPQVAAHLHTELNTSIAAARELAGKFQ